MLGKLSINVAKVMAVMSLAVTTMALNTRCYYIFGEPELPRSVRDKK
ncbi:cyclic lactone autoinducer peptide [Clostridium baratii]|uniref:Cyclic lactone autoinducer peptide n=1 Tax=Clostridium baratii TaxID=1561 RepID=A0A174RSL7_9CLOT|nr:cyclic lactone autoinducer peptide [Clostridium baratii]CUP85980.1 cyclic lactone autoinducer peptide [Clostridium baratii]